MDTGMYDVGYALGKHWAQRDATPGLLQRIKSLGDGRDWVTNSPDPTREFIWHIDPDRRDFLGTGETPSNSFVAGFIDGTRTVE